MKYKITEFLKKKSTNEKLCVEAIQLVGHSRQAVALCKAEGYAECLQDLVTSLKGCNSFALVSIEPAIRKIQYKAKALVQEAKGELK